MGPSPDCSPPGGGGELLGSPGELGEPGDDGELGGLGVPGEPGVDGELLGGLGVDGELLGIPGMLGGDEEGGELLELQAARPISRPTPSAAVTTTLRVVFNSVSKGVSKATSRLRGRNPSTIAGPS
ncbi:MAG: hypothetical protein VB949_18565 [Pseudomonadales bacterium]